MRCIIRKGKKLYRNFSLAEKVGAVIRKLRKGRKMSQHKLSAQCDLDNGEVSKIELGKVEPRMGTLERIAKVFSLKAWELMKMGEEMA